MNTCVCTEVQLLQCALLRLTAGVVSISLKDWSKKNHTQIKQEYHNEHNDVERGIEHKCAHWCQREQHARERDAQNHSPPETRRQREHLRVTAASPPAVSRTP